MTEGGPAEPGGRAAVADAFDTSPDPLAVHAATFAGLSVDPFGLFRDQVLANAGLAAGTLRKYDRVIEQWTTHMAREGRHPACPGVAHVRSFVAHCRDDRGNQPDTVRTKLRRLDRAYTYWQRDAVFPHESGFNPFTLTLSALDLSRPARKEPPRLSVADLGAILAGLTHVRDRAIVTAQLKLGLRAGELCNLRLADLHLTGSDLQDGYQRLGTADVLAGRPNAVWVPSRHDRQGNKSRRPRVLPIDAELRAVLRDYLLVRPDPATDAVFLTTSTHNPIQPEAVNRIWTDTFHPAYAETEHHRAVTSHFGRHRFTTHWQVAEPLPRELVKYLRGDQIAGESARREALDSYVHTYYEDVETHYRQGIYEFGLDGVAAMPAAECD